MRKLKNLFCKKQKPKWVDVGYHTGFYRFSKYISEGKTNFKVEGIPCLPQDGIEDFVFFSNTDLMQNVSMKDSNEWSWVIPVKQNF